MASRPAKRRDFLTFGAPLIGPEETSEVMEVLKSGWIGTGPRVARFEQLFREYKGAPHAVAVNSCTAALHLSLLAAGLSRGDEVITTPLTFCATINAVLHAGATPVLADVDPVTMNIDPAEIRKKITPRTRAILPVHFAGRPCDMDAIMAIAGEHKLMVIEDCAHAIEAEYKGRKCGTFGDFGCFSFYVTKNIFTGEGGMILAKTDAHANRLKMLALHGMSKDAWKRYSDDGYKHYQVMECGYKYNMMDLQAALALPQLKKIDEYLERRKSIWERYHEAFKKLPVTLPAPFEPATRHAMHLYTLLIDEARCGLARDAFLDKMAAMNIGTGVHYLSIPEHPFYQQSFGWKPGMFPNAFKIGRQTVSLPFSPKLSDNDVSDVVETVARMFNK